MQQRTESTPNGTQEPPDVLPPAIDPARWEDFEGFRETFLTHLNNPVHNVACRAFASWLYELVLEVPAATREPSERWVPVRIRGALGDLRFLEGFLASLGEEPRSATLTPANEALCRLMARKARAVGKIAAEIETALSAAEGR
jgi:hypothetical protein